MNPRDTQSALSHYGDMQRAADEAFNAELIARVNAEAKAATALPWWWPEAAVLAFIIAVALSAAFPMGVA